jgi:hypothetical protein
MALSCYLNGMRYLARLLLCLALLGPAPALAQAITQVGPVTAGHPTVWWQNGQVADATTFPAWVASFPPATLPLIGSEVSLCSQADVASTCPLMTLAPVTVETLPACNSGTANQLWAVTDATSPTWHSTLVGGGSVYSGALCNGLNWIAF